MVTDAQALADRRATGCHYDTGLCACPDAPYEFEGCLASRQVPPQSPADRPEPAPAPSTSAGAGLNLRPVGISSP